MKASQIKVGGIYTAKISGRVVKVRVDKIREVAKYARNYSGRFETRDSVVYDVTNLVTNRRTTFATAGKFRSAVPQESKNEPNSDRGNQHTGSESVSLPVPDVRVENSEAADGSAGGQESEATPVPAATTLASRLARPNQTDNAEHLIIEARAGTGKTTTLVEGLKRMKGLPSKFVPSEQQAKIWESMALSRNAKTVCFVAFNKAIATELQSRVPTGCDAMTMHSMGFKAATHQFGRVNVSQFRVQDILSRIDGRDIREIRKYEMAYVKGVEELVGLCKMNLIDNPSEEELDKLAGHYSVELNGQRGKVFAMVPRVLEACKDVSADNRIDYDDMIWLPVVLNLPVFTYDVLLVDEAQDLNRCQQALARRAGRRLILCGDPKQAIYGFAGADAESMPRMAAELGETARGCRTLPLTVTRRCGKAIVAEAQRIVPDFEAFETNPEGRVSTAPFKAQAAAPGTDGREEPSNGEPAEDNSYVSLVRDGDMILSRVNAPLVQQCFRFIKMGRRANIQGRDVGQGLISTIKKLKAESVVDLISKLSDWKHAEESKEAAKRNPSEQRLITIQDRYDCLVCFTDEAKTVEAVIAKIESVFTDDKAGPGIKLSSIHKAKGLESRQVFFIRTKEAPCPHPMAKTAWQREQEMHLLYVGITRAIESLVFVQ